jgi:hypothetical protein
MISTDEMQLRSANGFCAPAKQLVCLQPFELPHVDLKCIMVWLSHTIPLDTWLDMEYELKRVIMLRFTELHFCFELCWNVKDSGISTQRVLDGKLATAGITTESTTWYSKHFFYQAVNKFLAKIAAAKFILRWMNSWEWNQVSSNHVISRTLI